MKQPCDLLPPENEFSSMLDWKIKKGALDGQKVLHTGVDYQQAGGSRDLHYLAL